MSENRLENKQWAVVGQCNFLPLLRAHMEANLCLGAIGLPQPPNRETFPISPPCSLHAPNHFLLDLDASMSHSQAIFCSKTLSLHQTAMFGRNKNIGPKLTPQNACHGNLHCEARGSNGADIFATH